MKKTKIIQKSKLKTVILVLLLALPMTSNININSIFSKANQEVETLNTSAEVSMPITPKYEYVYENDFDYSAHSTQITSDFYKDDAVVVDGLIGENSEWSQNPTDADNLQLNFVGGLNRGAGHFYMNGFMVIESHNTFDKHVNPNLGVYIDWSIDLDISSEGIDLGSIRSYISLGIFKSAIIEDLVWIDILNQQEGTFYLANFDQYIGDNGKIKFALRGDIDGTTLWYFPFIPWILASIEIKGLRVVQEIRPQEYEYAYENDFDYSTHDTQITSFFWHEIIEEVLIGENTEWSQNPIDADNLQLNFVGGLCPWSLLFYMNGKMVVESHNTFEENLNPSSGVYIDWSIDLDISSEGIDLGSIQSQISLGIYKSNNFEELVMIGDLNQLEGTFYLANFNQFIWNDGKIRIAINGLVGGATLLNAEASWIYASIEIKGLRVEQEIKPIKAEAEKRTLIFVHGFNADSQPNSLNWWSNFRDALEFKYAYDNMIVISYYGSFEVYVYTSLYGELQPPDRYIVDSTDHTLMTPIGTISSLLYQFIRDHPDIIHDNVDFISHSMGGLVTRCMIKYKYGLLKSHYTTLGRNINIENVCMIGTPNHGVSYGWLTALIPPPLPPPTQLAQMAPGSLFLNLLNFNPLNFPLEIPYSGRDINWFTYRSQRYNLFGFKADGIVEVISVPLIGAINKGLYMWDHTGALNEKMMKTIIYNDIFEPSEFIQTIFSEATPGKIIGIEDLTIPLERETLSITLPPEIAIDIDPTSVYIEINQEYQMLLKEGTTDTYEVELLLTEGEYSILITANDLDGGLYQISGNLKVVQDMTPPIITIIFPTDDSITNQDVTLTYTVFDDFSETSDIIIIGDVNGTIYSSEESYDITITATDEAGNTASETVSFTIDKTAPVIDFNDPPEGYYNTEKTVEWEVTEENLDVVTANHPSGTTFVDEGTHTVTVMATDLAGNSASRSLTIVIDKTAPVITIEGPTAGYYNTDQEVSWSVSDINLANEYYTHPSPTTFTEDGTYQVIVSANDLAGNFASASSAEFVIDKTAPESSAEFGVPNIDYVEINNKIHLTSETPIDIVSEDTQGGSGVVTTHYKIFNELIEYDSGWLTYTGTFSLSNHNLVDGDYELSFFSTDLVGNSEDPKTVSLVVDNSPPTLSWEYEGTALQDGFLFEIEVGDATGVDESSIVVSIREHNGPIVADAIPGQFAEGLWQADKIFDTTTLPDGYYELIVDANDAFGFTTTQTFRFSIRNWAVLVLLPSTESNKAGRTMPVKFSLRVAFAVDPEMPFVVNQELDIFINDTATDEILQHSTYGDTSKDYRINVLTEQYITNFKTHKTPTTYFICIYRKDFFIGNFSFCTVK